MPIKNQFPLLRVYIYEIFLLKNKKRYLHYYSTPHVVESNGTQRIKLILSLIKRRFIGTTKLEYGKILHLPQFISSISRNLEHFTNKIPFVAQSLSGCYDPH